MVERLPPIFWTAPQKLDTPANFKRCSFLMSKYTLDFKYRAVPHTTKLHSQQRTTWHFNVSHTHLCRWVATYWQGGSTALQHRQTVSVKIKPKNRLSPANPITKKQAEPIEDWRDMRVEKGCTDRERNGAKHVAQRHVGKMLRWKVAWECWKRRASIKKLCYRWQTDRGHRWWTYMTTTIMNGWA